jgi:hypothetical protein
MKKPSPKPPPPSLPTFIFPLPPAGDVGIADPVHDLRRKARPIVGDGHRDVVAGPVRGDLDRAACEVDRVLDQIAQAIEDRRVASAHRLGGVVRG